MQFTHAIVKKPCENITKGITTARLGIPNYELAMIQHQKYCEALKSCGVNVTILEADENYPDSVFVEDTAVLTRECAIITNPGAVTRKNEIEKMIPVIESFFTQIEYIKSPGTLEGGDVMNVDNHYYIGLSDRTNKDGARQFIDILRKYKMNGTMVEMSEMLHLKTGLAYLGNNNLVIAGEFLQNDLYANFNRIKVDNHESYAANCININDTVILPKGYDEVRKKVESLNYNTLELDMSEFQKVDGGLSCLSLRFIPK